MTQFNPLRAQTELVAGLSEICMALKRRMNAAQIRVAEAESEYNDHVKLFRYAEDALDQARLRLDSIRNSTINRATDSRHRPTTAPDRAEREPTDE